VCVFVIANSSYILNVQSFLAHNLLDSGHILLQRNRWNLCIADIKYNNNYHDWRWINYMGVSRVFFKGDGPAGALVLVGT